MAEAHTVGPPEATTVEQAADADSPRTKQEAMRALWLLKGCAGSGETADWFRAPAVQTRGPGYKPTSPT